MTNEIQVLNTWAWLVSSAAPVSESLWNWRAEFSLGIRIHLQNKKIERYVYTFSSSLTITPLNLLFYTVSGRWNYLYTILMLRQRKAQNSEIISIAHLDLRKACEVISIQYDKWNIYKTYPSCLQKNFLLQTLFKQSSISQSGRNVKYKARLKKARIRIA